MTIIETYQDTKNKLSRSRLLKVIVLDTPTRQKTYSGPEVLALRWNLWMMMMIMIYHTT